MSAITLERPIYYIIAGDEDVSPFMIFRSNASRLKWSTLDYLDSYIRQGKEAYIHFQEIYDENRDIVNMMTCMSILTGLHRGEKALRLFREGDHHNTHIDVLNRLCAALRSIVNPIHLDIKRSKTVQMALLYQISPTSTEGFDLQHAIQKINQHNEPILYQDRNSFIEVLEEIYNHRKQRHIYLRRILRS